nr:MAG TPA: hypothetical protein [Caudoviricetes sp.]
MFIIPFLRLFKLITAVADSSSHNCSGGHRYQLK